MVQACRSLCSKQQFHIITFFRISYNLTKKWNLDIDFFQVLTYSNFPNIVRVLPTFSDWIPRLDPSLSNSVVAYKRHFFRNMASENSRDFRR